VSSVAIEIRRWTLVVGRWPFASRHLRLTVFWFGQQPRTNDQRQSPTPIF
jgi:hypothetical protein